MRLRLKVFLASIKIFPAIVITYPIPISIIVKFESVYTVSFFHKLSNLNYANLNKMYILLLAVVFLSFFNLGLNCRL